MFYDPDGNQIDRDKWGELFNTRFENNLVWQTKKQAKVINLFGREFEISPSWFVSTIWFGVNYNISGVGPPIIFESMIFGGLYDDFTYRYATKEEAKAGHEILVKKHRNPLYWLKWVFLKKSFKRERKWKDLAVVEESQKFFL